VHGAGIFTPVIVVTITVTLITTIATMDIAAGIH
jgi:hypothetical protein